MLSSPGIFATISEICCIVVFALSAPRFNSRNARFCSDWIPASSTCLMLSYNSCTPCFAVLKPCEKFCVAMFNSTSICFSSSSSTLDSACWSPSCLTFKSKSISSNFNCSISESIFWISESSASTSKVAFWFSSSRILALTSSSLLVLVSIWNCNLSCFNR